MLGEMYFICIYIEPQYAYMAYVTMTLGTHNDRYKGPPGIILFSLFITNTFGCTRKCRIIQMLYSQQYDILASNVVLLRSFKKMACSNVKYLYT